MELRILLTVGKHGILLCREAQFLTISIIHLPQIMKMVRLLLRKDSQEAGVKPLRNQLRILAEFMKSIDYINMKPDDENVIRLTGARNNSVRALTKGDELIAAYVSRRDSTSNGIGIEINLPERFI